MPIDAVIFDMDGLILDTEPLYRRVWQAAAGECGYRLSDAYFLRLVGRRSADCRRMLLEDFGPQFPLERVLDCARRHHKRAFNGPIPLKSGLIELLDDLDRRRLRRAVATSTDRRRASTQLGAAGLLERFEHLTTGDEVEHGKPAPDIFLAAASKLGVPPNHCLVLEDSEPGIAAAHAAGMMPVMVPDLLQPCDTTRMQCRAVLPSLHQVCALLDELHRP
jgi:HAD superfamily hydrolase (TIGR01509 family)